MTAQTSPGPSIAPNVGDALALFRTLASPGLVQDLLVASHRRFYDRVFGPLVVLWGFVYQRLNSNHTLDAALAHLSSGAVDGLGDPKRPPISKRIRSESTAAYSKGRGRLPLSVLQGVGRHLARKADAFLGEDACWHGHQVALLDGSTFAVYPNGDLVEHYGQAENQHGACYWVVVRMLAAFGLKTGALWDIAEGPQTQSEQALAKEVLARLPENTIVIGDGNFGVYSVVQSARHYHSLTLLRLTPSRAQALAKAQPAPNQDRLILWAPSKHDQTDPQMSSLPIPGRLISGQLVRDGFRPIDLYLFTTLVDARTYPVDELVECYCQRWQVELDLLYVKSLVGLEVLSAKSVEMVRKELWAVLIAYNLVRAAMVLGAKPTSRSPLTLSFTKCYHRLQAALGQAGPSAGSDAPGGLPQPLLSRLAKCVLQRRIPFRAEPRAVRRRRRPYPPLKGTRQQARESARRQALAMPTKC